MNDELVLESSAPILLAPASRPQAEVGVDAELERDLKAIPDKLAFKIGEVADIVGVKAYVLRYWETEFAALKPKKSKHNQRMYERRDVETLLLIKKLLYRDRFSIEGARAALKKVRSESQSVKRLETVVESVEQVILDTEDLLDHIRRLKTIFQRS